MLHSLQSLQLETASHNIVLLQLLQLLQFLQLLQLLQITSVQRLQQGVKRRNLGCLAAGLD